ncbi:MAG TPA: hypothetical protein VHF47_07860 [Acidimicrobiales bacterium]|nr:hypothetical protein [Acidimicrobiales bacterium]
MPSLFDRRSFLLASAGLVAAAACNRPGSDRPDIEVESEDSGPSDVALVTASYVHVTGLDERLTLALVRDNGPEVLREPLDVTITDPDGKKLGTVRGELHADGIPLPYLLVRRRFDRTGVYEAAVRYNGRTLETTFTVEDPARVQVPVPGRPLIATPTPTVADGRGVSPICTRDPVCPLHDVSLDAALAERRPMAVLFSTPALCKSQLCGPVLENLLSQHAAFGSRVRFLHVEIYTDTSGKTTAPAVQAYHLESEPFLFLAGADGVVRERLDNAFDRAEAKAALERLVAAS